MASKQITIKIFDPVESSDFDFSDQEKQIGPGEFAFLRQHVPLISKPWALTYVGARDKRGEFHGWHLIGADCWGVVVDE